jgi:hypothetical protein
VSELKQRAGESPAEWLARLRQITPGTLSEHERFFLLQHALDSARVAVKRQADDASYALALRCKESPPGAGPGGTAPATPGPEVTEGALGLCQKAFLALGLGDRERFLRWLADTSK